MAITCQSALSAPRRHFGCVALVARMRIDYSTGRGLVTRQPNHDFFMHTILRSNTLLRWLIGGRLALVEIKLNESLTALSLKKTKNKKTGSARVVRPPTFSSQVAPHIVVMTTYNASMDENLAS